MTFDEFEKECAGKKKDELIKMAWNWIAEAHSLREAYFTIEKQMIDVGATSDFLVSVIKKHSLENEINGDEVERYKESAREQHAKQSSHIGELINRSVSLLNSERKRNNAIEQHQNSEVGKAKADVLTSWQEWQRNLQLYKNQSGFARACRQ